MIRNLRKRGRIYNKGILITALTLIGVLVLCEIGLRVYYTGCRQRIAAQRRLGQGKCFRTDPVLIYRGASNVCGNNALGYRDSDHRYEKAEDVFRIVVIGDSVAKGQGVTQSESFTSVLKKKFQDSLPHTHIEVIVLAESGYSTSQELALLKDQAVRYKPDMIIWSYVLNDPAHPFYHNANGELGRYFLRPKSYLGYFLKRKLFFLRERDKAHCRHCDKEFHKFLHCVYWENVEKNFEEVKRYVEDENIPLVCVIHPVFRLGKSFDTYDLSDLHQQLKRLADSYGFIVVDILDAYKGYRCDELNQPGDVWHPNAKGHFLIAQYIYQCIFDMIHTKTR